MYIWVEIFTVDSTSELDEVKSWSGSTFDDHPVDTAEQIEIQSDEEEVKSWTGSTFDGDTVDTTEPIQNPPESEKSLPPVQVHKEAPETSSPVYALLLTPANEQERDIQSKDKSKTY